ncbi:hypothetical protein PESP_a1416 [Pseudoalteromonas espejiana DSM 9414]|nr:hypothetical protein PESP_a1416 [Pseudoalteromonas espejiana DSM 9414]
MNSKSQRPSAGFFVLNLTYLAQSLLAHSVFLNYKTYQNFKSLPITYLIHAL